MVKKNNNMELKLTDLIKVTWGEDFDTSKAYADLLMDHMSYAQAEYLVIHDSFFNRYNDTSSYTELISEMICDDAFFGDEYKEFVDELMKLDDKEESKKEAILRKDGWIVGFGVSIKVCEEEIEEVRHVL